MIIPFVENITDFALSSHLWHIFRQGKLSAFGIFLLNHSHTSHKQNLNLELFLSMFFQGLILQQRCFKRIFSSKHLVPHNPLTEHVCLQVFKLK